VGGSLAGRAVHRADRQRAFFISVFLARAARWRRAKWGKENDETYRCGSGAGAWADGAGGDGENAERGASFSVLGDMVQQVGASMCMLTTLVGPDGDPHTFEPSPKTARC
jgi:hypothetical protein